METLLLQTTNRKLFMTSSIAAIPMTFKVTHMLQAFSNGIFRTVVQQLTRLQLA